MTNPNSSTSPELDALLRDAAAGDALAVRGLLERHRSRLRRMIAARLDRRLAPRLDPSDVVQETLADAARRLPDYLRDRPMPFYAWLFRLAADRLARTHRDHVASTVRGDRAGGAARRAVATARRPCRAGSTGWRPRADARPPDGPRGTATPDWPGRSSGWTRPIARSSACATSISLAFDEIAAVLEIGLSAAKMRHLRALERLRGLLEELGVEPSTSLMTDETRRTRRLDERAARRPGRRPGRSDRRGARTPDLGALTRR